MPKKTALENPVIGTPESMPASVEPWPETEPPEPTKDMIEEPLTISEQKRLAKGITDDLIAASKNKHPTRKPSPRPMKYGLTTK